MLQDALGVPPHAEDENLEFSGSVIVTLPSLHVVSFLPICESRKNLQHGPWLLQQLERRTLGSSYLFIQFNLKSSALKKVYLLQTISSFYRPPAEDIFKNEDAFAGF